MDIKNYAQVDVNGNVTNVAAWDGVSDFPQPDGITLVQSDVAGIGWTYANGVFTNPNADQQ